MSGTELITKHPNRDERKVEGKVDEVPSAAAYRQ